MKILSSAVVGVLMVVHPKDTRKSEDTSEREDARAPDGKIKTTAMPPGAESVGTMSSGSVVIVSAPPHDDAKTCMQGDKPSGHDTDVTAEMNQETQKPAVKGKGKDNIGQGQEDHVGPGPVIHAHFSFSNTISNNNNAGWIEVVCAADMAGTDEVITMAGSQFDDVSWNPYPQKSSDEK